MSHICLFVWRGRSRSANIQLTVFQTDAYGNNLDKWLVFAEPGDIITIREDMTGAAH